MESTEAPYTVSAFERVLGPTTVSEFDRVVVPITYSWPNTVTFELK